MASVFSKIVNGEIPCYKIAENEAFLAFLDITPLRKGHTLVIPKKETDYIFDIDDQQLAEFIQFAKVVANKIKAVIPCKKVGMTVIGLEVPHAHIHLSPMNTIADMDFSQPRLVLDAIEMEEITQLIANQ
jgi:histidine triad (HIT) family protein